MKVQTHGIFLSERGMMNSGTTFMWNYLHFSLSHSFIRLFDKIPNKEKLARIFSELWGQFDELNGEKKF
jgi:hypothetical protein